MAKQEDELYHRGAPSYEAFARLLREVTPALHASADIKAVLALNELQPNQPTGFTTKSLAEAFQMSPSAVREALRILEKEGIIAIKPRYGMTILRPDLLIPAESQRETLKELHMSTLVLLARAAAENASLEDVVRMEGALAVEEQVAGLVITAGVDDLREPTVRLPLRKFVTRELILYQTVESSLHNTWVAPFAFGHGIVARVNIVPWLNSLATPAHVQHRLAADTNMISAIRSRYPDQAEAVVRDIFNPSI